MRFSVNEEFAGLGVKIIIPERRYHWYWTGRTACRVVDKAVETWSTEHPDPSWEDDWDPFLDFGPPDVWLW